VPVTNFTFDEPLANFYHTQLMEEAGLIQGITFSGDDEVHVCPTRLTYAGHEFLNNIRPNAVWEKVLETLAEKAGTVTLTAVIALASEYARKAIFGG
jgi:Hypothetical protein (DUF2513)